MISIYVLECEHGKYYVGKTRQRVSSRYLQHKRGCAARWTKIHPPIRLIESFEGDAFDEDKVTKQYMALEGINNVRGGTYCTVSISRPTRGFLQNEIKSASSACLKCGSSGHWVRNCPRNKHHRVATRGKKESTPRRLLRR